MCVAKRVRFATDDFTLNIHLSYLEYALFILGRTGSGGGGAAAAAWQEIRWIRGGGEVQKLLCV